MLSYIQYYITGSNLYGKLGLNYSNEIRGLAKFTTFDSFQGKNISNISVGWQHILAVDNQHKLYGWGNNEFGELTQQESQNVTRPQEIFYFSGNNISIEGAAAGMTHSVVYTTDKKHVYSFGDNTFQQLGRKTENRNDSNPQLVDLINIDSTETIASLKTTSYTNYLLMDSGNVYIWGYCINSLCPGHNDFEIIDKPTKIIVPTQIKQIYAGLFNFWFIDVNGDLYSFGANQRKQLCAGSDLPQSSTPLKVNLQNVTRIRAGSYHTLIESNNSFYVCGSNELGQFGFITQETQYSTPIEIDFKQGQIQDFAATYQGTYLVSNSTLYASGREQVGELSLNITQYVERTFTQVNDLYVERILAYNDNAFLIANSEKQPQNDASNSVLVAIAVTAAISVLLGDIAIYMVLRKHKHHYDELSSIVKESVKLK